MTTEEHLVRALRMVAHEVTHKKGGPERKECVSVPYLHKTVTAALAEYERRKLPAPVVEPHPLAWEIG